mmetsp:Transcript_8782/g.13497  ORF Transcript_8782/g.13497 Transcript_8782/m.13497 type:complete len:443 (+) Transcript_8782:33-1361(+)
MSEETHGGFWLKCKSEEYMKVKYMINTYLQQEQQLFNLLVWKIDTDSPKEIASFPHFWIDTESLHGQNSLLEICRRRQFLTNEGELLRFCQGSLISSPQAKNDMYQCVYCHVRVGRSYVIEDPSQSLSRIPVGYESLYLLYESDDAKHHHVYAVPSTNAFPLYVARFSIRAFSLEKDSDNDEEVSRHDQKDFFDPVHFRAVSVRDKMIGDYSSGPLAEFKLLPIEDAYDAVWADRQRLAAQINNRQNEIKQQLDKLITQNKKSVHVNHTLIEQKIYHILQTTLHQLEQKTKHKLASIQSNELELRRKLAHLDLIANRFIDLEDNCDETNGVASNAEEQQKRATFVRNWADYRSLAKNDLEATLKEPKVNDLDNLIPKLELNGSLRISEENDDMRAIDLASGTPQASPPSISVVVPGLMAEQRIDNSTKRHFKEALENLNLQK